MTYGKIGMLEYKIDPITGCFICISHHTSRKYECPQIKINHHQMRVPRYVYEMFNDDLTKDKIVRHTCDNPLCINPNHLIIGTHADNVTDRVNRKRNAVGESNGRHKLTKESVVEIYFSSLTQTELSKKYNIDRTVIRDIWYKRKWKTITENFLPMWHINKKYYNSKK